MREILKDNYFLSEDGCNDLTDFRDIAIVSVNLTGHMFNHR